MVLPKSTIHMLHATYNGTAKKYHTYATHNGTAKKYHTYATYNGTAKKYHKYATYNGTAKKYHTYVTHNFYWSTLSMAYELLFINNGRNKSSLSS